MTAAPDDPWTVAIHAGEKEHGTLGTGVVVDTNLVLTCEHVACVDGRLRDELWISFPRSGVPYWERRRVRQCLHNGRPEQNIDLVLLELVDPVPVAVTPARLRCLPEQAMVGRPWWTYGFPQHTEGGRSAHGRVIEKGGWGRIRLTAESDPGIVKGFSGGALWSPDYQAVVGLVIEHGQGGEAHALAFGYANDKMPELKLGTLAGWRLEDADDDALAAWGWQLTTDPEAGRHWLPRARGVAADSERGYRFRGRETALRHLTAWLDRDAAAGHPLIVTGSPGVGKSAVLGRIVTTADPDVNAGLPPGDTAVRATVGSVSCAVHAKGKNALEVATEIARAVGLGLPAAPVDVVPALRDHLAGRGERFNLVVDALDEAASPEQARVLIRDVLVPLARDGVHVGVQVVVGTRRKDDLGLLPEAFGAGARIIDLDAPEYFAEADLADYAQATLQLLGQERPGNPYTDPAVAAPVARRIAALAEGNFLVAALVARARALRDDRPADPADVVFAGTVGHALDTYLTGLPMAGGAPARLVLTALAFAETPGLPLSLWRAATEALGGRVTESELSAFAHTSAANFLVETAGAGEPAYRLFHQALNDELCAQRPHRRADEQRLVRAWIEVGHATGWAAAPEYLLRLLPGHAARCGLLDDLLAEDEYLLHVHLDRLLRVVDAVTGEAGRARANLLRRTPMALGAPAAERAALFSVVDRLDGLGSGFLAVGAPYRARWAHTPPRQERTVLEAHSQAVYDVCAIEVEGRNLLASAGEDGTVRLWDPLTNQSEHRLDCHDDSVRGVCAVRAGSDTLLATASHDGTICLWDPISGNRVHRLAGHEDWVRNICTVPLPHGDLLASAGDDWTVRIWDPASGEARHVLSGHTGWVTAVTHVPAGPAGMLASTGFDGTVRLWDPLTGRLLHKLSGHRGWVTTLYAARSGGRTLLASAGYDGTVRLWDPLTGEGVRHFETGSGALTDLCTVETGNGCLLVSTGEDGVIRMWDLASGAQRPPLRGHSSWIRAVCELPLADRNVLATAGDDGTVRLWDPDGGSSGPVTGGRPLGAVTALCEVVKDDHRLVAAAGSDGTIRLLDPRDGEVRAELSGESGPVNGLCPVVDEGVVHLAAANGDGTVRLWEVRSGERSRDMSEHFDSVNAVCVLETDDGVIMASAGDDATVRLWKPHDAKVREGLTGHGDWVTSLTVVERSGREALASAAKNGTVRLWDSDGAALWDQHGHPDAVNALCAVTVAGEPVLVSAGADGVLRLWDPRDGRPLAELAGHSASVTGVCTLAYGGRDILVSTSLDRTVRLWDPGGPRLLRSIPVYHPALSCRFVDGTLVVGLAQGLLALAVSGEAGRM
ncbi:trypsin-like peptidase domain-containing protein [Actinoplanes sp. NPDC049316]|uniref:trypsin-like peptidase domain-containing protein n=1 Tax=Actinoplanes sp. NPDC049316 TaxID=3154727 RepID=UPI003439287D